MVSMPAANTWILGLELTRFAPSDDQADSLGQSLDVVESGALELSPYAGPALQPYVQWNGGSWRLGLAPAFSMRADQSNGSDGRSQTLRVCQWRMAGQALWSPNSWFVGLESAGSGGRATLAGDVVGAVEPGWEVGPTGGVRGSVADNWDLGGRVRLPLMLDDEGWAMTLGGGLALEWHR